MLAEHRAVAKEIAAYRRADHTHLRVGLLVQSIDEATFGKRQPEEVAMGRRHAPHLGFALAGCGRDGVGLDGDARHDELDPGDALADRRDVARRETGRLLANLRHFLGLQLAGAQEHIAHPQLLDHRERLSLGPCADRQHGDHRTHAEKIIPSIEMLDRSL